VLNRARPFRFVGLLSGLVLPLKLRLSASPYATFNVPLTRRRTRTISKTGQTCIKQYIQASKHSVRCVISRPFSYLALASPFVGRGFVLSVESRPTSHVALIVSTNVSVPCTLQPSGHLVTSLLSKGSGAKCKPITVHLVC
jgi:hypothetical protein